MPKPLTLFANGAADSAGSGGSSILEEATIGDEKCCRLAEALEDDGAMSFKMFEFGTAAVAAVPCPVTSADVRGSCDWGISMGGGAGLLLRSNLFARRESTRVGRPALREVEEPS